MAPSVHRQSNKIELNLTGVRNMKFAASEKTETRSDLHCLS